MAYKWGMAWQDFLTPEEAEQYHAFKKKRDDAASLFRAVRIRLKNIAEHRERTEKKAHSAQKRETP